MKSDLTEWTINAPAGCPPPEAGSQDEQDVLEHIVDLLRGAQSWMDVLDGETGLSWHAADVAATELGTAANQVEST